MTQSRHRSTNVLTSAVDELAGLTAKTRVAAPSSELPIAVASEFGRVAREDRWLNGSELGQRKLDYAKKRRYPSY